MDDRMKQLLQKERMQAVESISNDIPEASEPLEPHRMQALRDAADRLATQVAGLDGIEGLPLNEPAQRLPDELSVPVNALAAFFVSDQAPPEAEVYRSTAERLPELVRTNDGLIELTAMMQRAANDPALREAVLAAEPAQPAQPEQQEAGVLQRLYQTASSLLGGDDANKPTRDQVSADKMADIERDQWYRYEWEVAEGDTLEGIARAIYRDPRMAEYIAEVNDMSVDDTLSIGQRLVIPPVTGTPGPVDDYYDRPLPGLVPLRHLITDDLSGPMVTLGRNWQQLSDEPTYYDKSPSSVLLPLVNDAMRRPVDEERLATLSRIVDAAGRMDPAVEANMILLLHAAGSYRNGQYDQARAYADRMEQ